MGSSTTHSTPEAQLQNALKFAGICLVFALVTSSRFGRKEKSKMFSQMQEARQDSYESTIPGAPGQDYPTFSTAPATSFDCGGLVQGYYADLETDCQAYHVCGSDPARTAPISTLLCPNGTLYNQQYFVCDWWFNVDCSVAADFYGINEDIARAAEEANELRRARNQQFY